MIVSAVGRGVLQRYLSRGQIPKSRANDGGSHHGSKDMTAWIFSQRLGPAKASLYPQVMA
jgi:hypothetical protein